MNKTIVIIGSNGYIGKQVSMFFYNSNNIIGISKQENSNKFCHKFIKANVRKIFWCHYLDSFNIDYVINCSYDFIDIDQNYNDKYKIFDINLSYLSKKHNCTFVNISTTSSFKNAVSNYGKEKFYIEQVFNQYRSLNIRLGLVTCMDKPGSAFLKLVTLRRGIFFPVLYSKDLSFYYCDIQDFLYCLNILLKKSINKSHLLTFAYNEKLSFINLINLISKKLNKKIYPIYIHWSLVYLLLFIKESFLGIKKIRSDSIIDYVNQNKKIQNTTFFNKNIKKKINFDSI